MDKLEKDGKINKEERYRLRMRWTLKEGRPKKGNVVENLRKELRRMCVLNDREDMWKFSRLQGDKKIHEIESKMVWYNKNKVKNKDDEVEIKGKYNDNYKYTIVYDCIT